MIEMNAHYELLNFFAQCSDDSDDQEEDPNASTFFKEMHVGRNEMQPATHSFMRKNKRDTD